MPRPQRPLLILVHSCGSHSLSPSLPLSPSLSLSLPHPSPSLLSPSLLARSSSALRCTGRPGGIACAPTLTMHESTMHQEALAWLVRSNVGIRTPRDQPSELSSAAANTGLGMGELRACSLPPQVPCSARVCNAARISPPPSLCLRRRWREWTTARPVTQ